MEYVYNDKSSSSQAPQTPATEEDNGNEFPEQRPADEEQALLPHPQLMEADEDKRYVDDTTVETVEEERLDKRGNFLYRSG
jgi:hypothetical protein